MEEGNSKTCEALLGVSPSLFHLVFLPNVHGRRGNKFKEACIGVYRGFMVSVSPSNSMAFGWECEAKTWRLCLSFKNSSDEMARDNFSAAWNSKRGQDYQSLQQIARIAPRLELGRC